MNVSREKAITIDHNDENCMPERGYLFGRYHYQWFAEVFLSVPPINPKNM